MNQHSRNLLDLSNEFRGSTSSIVEKASSEIIRLESKIRGLEAVIRIYERKYAEKRNEE